MRGVWSFKHPPRLQEQCSQAGDCRTSAAKTWLDGDWPPKDVLVEQAGSTTSLLGRDELVLAGSIHLDRMQLL